MTTLRLEKSWGMMWNSIIDQYKLKNMAACDQNYFTDFPQNAHGNIYIEFYIYRFHSNITYHYFKIKKILSVLSQCLGGTTIIALQEVKNILICLIQFAIQIGISPKQYGLFRCAYVASNTCMYESCNAAVSSLSWTKKLL